MKSICISIAVFFITHPLAAQQRATDSLKLVLTIKDSITNKGIEYATIKIYRDANRQFPLGGISDNKGMYKFTASRDNLSQGLLAVFSAIGFLSKTITISGTGSKEYEVWLSRQVDTLQNVIVQSKNVFKRDIDKLSFKIEPGNYPKNSALADILNNVPSLSINTDGNVTIKGRIAADIYLDGKLVSKEILKALPLNLVERIEIIDAPSAVFTSNNGIVNIITKKIPASILQGRASMKAGLIRQVYAPFGNTLLKSKKLFANFTVSWQNRAQPKYTEMNRMPATTAVPALYQEQEAKDRINFFYTSADVFYDWDSLTRIAGSVYYNIINVKSGVNVYNVFDGNPFTSEHHYKYKNNNLIADVDIKRKLKKQSSLSFTNRFYTGRNPMETENSINYTGKKTLQTIFLSKEYSHSYSTQLLLNKVFRKKTELDIGIVYSWYVSTSPFENAAYDTILNQYVPVAANTDESKFTKNIVTPFASFKFKIKEFGFRIGMRNEINDLQFKYRNATTVVPAIKTLNLLPNILVQRSLKNDINVSLQYKQTVKRPDIVMLNQFLTSDLFGSQNTGNSFLVPELNHQVSLSLDKTKAGAKKIFFGNYTAYYTNVKNPIFEGLFTPDDTLIVRKFINIRRQETIGASASFFFQFPEKGSINFTLFAENTSVPAFDTELKYNKRYFVAGGNFSAEYQFRKSGSLSLDLTVRNREFDFQYIINKFPNLLLSYRKQVLKNKISLMMSYVNVLSKGSDRRSRFSNNVFIITNDTRVRSNNLVLTVTYSFGKKIRNIFSKTSIQPDDTKERKTKFE